MKNLLLFLFISLSGGMQLAAQEIVDAADVADDAAAEAVYDYDYDYQPSMSTDTLRIAAGKPYAIVINIDEYGVSTGGDNIDDIEIPELKKNFKDENLEILVIRENCLVIFENGNKIDLTSSEIEYESFGFWSGNKTEDVELMSALGRIGNATEFISEKLNLDKQSSYNINTVKYREEVALLLKKNNITKNSKATQNKLLEYYINGEALYRDTWVVQDFEKMKSQKIRTIKSTVEDRTQTVDFNENGQLSTLSFLAKKGQDKGKLEFIYENEMLVQIKNGERVIKVNYDDDKMIVSENIGDADETKVYWLENNVLLKNSYILMDDNTYPWWDMFIQEKIKDACLLSYTNNVLDTKNCASKMGTFPYINSYTSYTGEEVMQFRKYKVEQTSDKVFKKYKSNAENENEKDDYQLVTTFYFSEDNLISKIENEEFKIGYEYLYFE